MGCCNDKRPPRPPRPSVPCPDKYIDLSKIPAESYDDTDLLIGMNKCGLLHPVEKPEKLDKIVIDGDGTKVLTDDGQYKDIGEITDDLNYVAYNTDDDAELKKSIILKNAFSIKAADKDGTIFPLLALSAVNEARLGNLSLPLVYVSRNRPTIITLENGNEVAKKVAYQDEIPDVSDLAQLRTDVGKNTNDISVLETQMSNVVGGIADINNDITGVKGRMTAAEGKIAVNERDISTNKNDITALKGRVDGHDSDVSGLGTRVTNNETNITNATNQLGNAETNIHINTNDIAGIKSDLSKTEHFRGYLDANVEIALLPNPRNGDYAYSAESGTVWSYNGVTWVNTGKVVPDKTVPAYNMMPNMDGVGSSGISDAYARGDHRHPTDITRASAVDLIATNSNVTVVSDALGAYKAANDTRVYIAEGNINTNKNEIDALKGRVTQSETDISVNKTDIAGLRADMVGKEHFRGYYATTSEVITISSPEKGDFVYNAQTGTKWAYNGAAWSDTLSIVPDQTVEGSNDMPIMNGASTPGASNKYSRSDHVHPMDSTRASSVDLNATNQNVTNLGDRVTVNETNITTIQGQINDLPDFDEFALKTDIPVVPANVSAFNNDSGYITASDVDLSGYYTKIETDTKLTNYAKSADLAAVAKSGDYNDLKNKPTTPPTGWGTITGTLSDQTDLKSALDKKVDKVAGKDLSDDNYTTVEKTKLAGVEAGAQKNVQSDCNQIDTTKDDYIKNKPDLTIYAEKSDLPTNVSAFNNDAKYVTESGLGTMAGEDKDDYVKNTALTTALSKKVTKVHAGTNIIVTGTDENPIISMPGLDLPEKFTSTDGATGVVGDAVTGLDFSNVAEIVTGSTFGLNDIVIFSNGIQGQVVTYDSGAGTYDIVIVQIPEATAWGAIGGALSNQTDLKAAFDAKTNDADLKTVAKSGSYNDLTDKPTIPPTGWGTIAGTLTDQTDLKTALDGKVDKVAGKDLSDDNYTTVEKTKLAGVEASAQVNVQSDWDQSDTTKDDFVNNKPDLSVYAEKTELPDLTPYVKSVDLAVVATSGSYDDLDNKPVIPVIPTNVSAFNNDAGYITLNDIPDVDLANVVKYDGQRNVDLTGDGDLIVDIDKVVKLKGGSDEIRALSSEAGGNMSIVDIPVGFNLRGKTIVFAPDDAPLIYSDSSVQLRFIASYTGGGYGSISVSGGDNLLIYIEDEFNHPNNIDVYSGFDGGWIQKTYTFPDDADFIVQSNELKNAVVFPEGGYSLSDAYVDGEYYSNIFKVGDTTHNTIIQSKSRPVWNNGTESKLLATVEQFFNHAFVTQSQYDNLGDIVNHNGITYFIVEALQRVIFIRNDTTTHDYYFLISKKKPTTQQLLSLGTQIGAGGSMDSISKYLDVNNDVKKLVNGINDLTIYYGENTGSASLIPVTEDNIYIVTI